MKVLAVGGGSGGHVTPVVAVINELAKQDAHLRVEFVCDKGFADQSRGLMKRATIPVNIRVISAGKFRRYAHLTAWQHFAIPQVVVQNIHDIFKIGIGLIQSLWILLRFRPDVVFAKGGFVCLPLGTAAHLLRIPLVIHDSDTRAGLTNKVLGRWAKVIATGSPLENYSYDRRRSVYVGVPIDSGFSPKTSDEIRTLKTKIGVDPDRILVVVTGGGLGARSINDAMVACAGYVLARDVAVYHVTGKKHFDAVSRRVPQSDHYRVVPFVYDGMSSVLGAADIVVCRASATTLQELAGLAKAVIIVPAHQLGDQIKNAEVYRQAGAGIVLDNLALQEQPTILPEAIYQLAGSRTYREQLAGSLHAFARPLAAADLAKLITGAARH